MKHFDEVSDLLFLTKSDFLHALWRCESCSCDRDRGDSCDCGCDDPIWGRP